MAQNNNWREFIVRRDEEETEVYVGNTDRNKLSIKVDVDVSEALSGLKAVQREAKEAAKAVRELETAVLHKGEVILPKSIADKFKTSASPNGIRISSDFFKVRNESDIEQIAKKLYELINKEK